MEIEARLQLILLSLELIVMNVIRSPLSLVSLGLIILVRWTSSRRLPALLLNFGIKLDW